MATRQTANGVAFICDACEAEWLPPRLGSEPRDFSQSYFLAREEGWRAVQIKSKIPGKKDWEHRCSECA